MSRSAAAVIIVVLVTACSGGATATPSPRSGGPSPAATIAPAQSASASASQSASAASLAASVPASRARPPEVSPPPSASATPVVAASLPPASFQLTVAGDNKAAGVWGTSYGITCDNPSFDGPNLLFFAQSPDKSAVVLVTVTATSIDVNERAGAGANYTSRDFTGPGVSAFDAAKGATFDSDLTESQNTGQKPGKLGAISHVSGSVDCGNQTAGTSTVQVAGAISDGAVSGPFESSLVSCVHSAQYGDSVSVSAIVTAGTTPTLLIINFPSNDMATIFAVSKDGQSTSSYAIDPSGVQDMTPTGGHVDADFSQVGASGTPRVVHLAGDLVCGPPIST